MSQRDATDQNGKNESLEAEETPVLWRLAVTYERNQWHLNTFLPWAHSWLVAQPTLLEREVLCHWGHRTRELPVSSGGIKPRGRLASKTSLALKVTCLFNAWWPKIRQKIVHVNEPTQMQCCKQNFPAIPPLDATHVCQLRQFTHSPVRHRATRLCPWLLQKPFVLKPPYALLWLLYKWSCRQLPAD